MKRVAMIMIVGLAYIATAACSPTEESVKTEEPVPAPEQVPGNGRALVVCFSCTNTTKGIAERIAEITDGTLHSIVPEIPYTSEDLNYNNSSSRANREQHDPATRPAISNKVDNFADYDVVFLGYPIWWGKAPKIILTFLENHNLSDKTIVPFCTSHSSGIGSSDTDLHEFAEQAVWKQGRRLMEMNQQKQLKNGLKV